MEDWNVVVSVLDEGFVQACEILDAFGPVRRTDYYNVLVMRVEDTGAFLAEFARLVEADPHVLKYIARVIPAAAAFSFQTPEEFMSKARNAVLQWVERLLGRSFHVRMHRRGFKGRISSLEVERLLNRVLLDAMEARGAPGRISFKDPDAILAVETVGRRAGLSLWSREDIKRFPFLKLN